jgi:hypothetical protein
MKKYEGELVHNFEWVYIIPEFDQKLSDMIATYNSLEYGNAIMKQLDLIFDRISEIKGITFKWV